eukprot:Nitzschia sp. Nitz4//scaffold165_size50357//31700//36390//NITZ4_007023-RA/size50357-processed-gene-0.9-mRNA-1//1//CDS//3329538138//1340//frame0
MAESITPTKCACEGCGEAYPSKSALFKHLRETAGACLKGDEYTEFLRYLRSTDRGVKVGLLFGYLPVEGKIRNGDDAADILLQAIQTWQTRVDGFEQQQQNKYNRSFGFSQRGVSVVAQDEGTGAVSEVLTTYLQPLPQNTTVENWIDQIQLLLDSLVQDCPVRLLGRQDIAAKKFNAEMDASLRRIEYILPVDFFFSYLERCKLHSLPTFSENHKQSLHHEHNPGANPIQGDTRHYLFRLKKLMQSMTTQITELEKSQSKDKPAIQQKRKGNSRRSKKRRQISKGGGHMCDDEKEESNKEEKAEDQTEDQVYLPRRKRFHNFTPNLMAHEDLAFRRMDRIYHRATLRFPHLVTATATSGSANRSTPFLVLSFNGDMFLTGQVSRLVGVFLAIANDLVDQDILDCLFDEDYLHLIPTPPAPIVGIVAAEANYMTWEGKLKTVLAARSTDRYSAGWNQKCTLERVEKWRNTVHETVASKWISQGYDESGRLVLERDWTTQILEPWAKQARKHLDEYRQWKMEKQAAGGGHKSAICHDLGDKIDVSVPAEYARVLNLLREVDQTGRWPSTTMKRQLVMVSTTENEGEENETASLALAQEKARDNRGVVRSSAYSFLQGQGGASGSFSVGFMPGGTNKQPKSNDLFPELVQAAFELERKLCPEREPSSTIAINRNAQFRPHTDSGAGAGQSSSLIVGLGAYAGGELMVEGKKEDIRYRAIEFNGWKQRHWTLPFVGERYSLGHRNASITSPALKFHGMNTIEEALSSAKVNETVHVCVEDEEGNQQEIALAAFLDEKNGGFQWNPLVSDNHDDFLRRHLRTKQWFFPMLNDHSRNQAYHQAIQMATKQVVSRFGRDNDVLQGLDIGSGTGLLAMMSARSLSECLEGKDYSADIRITSLEMSSAMATIARLTISSNNLDQTILVEEAHSCERPPLETKAHICTSELLESGLLAEGWIPAIRDAWKRHLHPDAVVVPSGVKVFAQVIGGESLLNYWGPHGHQEPFTLHPLSLGTLEDGCVLLKSSSGIRIPMHVKNFLKDPEHPIELLSDPITLFDIRLDSKDTVPTSDGQTVAVPFVPTASGIAQGVIFWWQLDLFSDQVSYSTQYDKGEWQDHWQQCLFIFSKSPTECTKLVKGELATLKGVQSDYDLQFDVLASLPEQVHSRKKPRVSDSVVNLISPLRAWQLNDRRRIGSFQKGITWLLQQMGNDSVVLDVSDFSLCAMMAALSGALNVASMEASSSALPEMTARIAQLSNKLLSQDGKKFQLVRCHPEHMSLAALDGSLASVVLAEPYFEVSEGWPVHDAINYFYILRGLRNRAVLSPNYRSLPTYASIQVCAVESFDLASPYKPCDKDIFGCSHAVVNEHCTIANHQLSLETWQYGFRKLSEPTELARLDYDSGIIVNNCQKTTFPFLGSGICHAMLLWVDYGIPSGEAVCDTLTTSGRGFKQLVQMLPSAVKVGKSGHCTCKVSIGGDQGDDHGTPFKLEFNVKTD